QYGAAIEGGEAALEIRERLSNNHPEQSGYFRDVAIQLKDLGDIYKRAGRQTRACQYFQAAVAQFDKLDRRWEMSEFDRNRAYAYAQKSTKDC
ncbi:MAG: hypothetical protein AAGM33_08845, partial [Pseudomonadota bacterium]